MTMLLPESEPFTGFLFVFGLAAVLFCSCLLLFPMCFNACNSEVKKAASVIFQTLAA